MAYQIVKDNFYTQQVNLPLGVQTENVYGIRYDPETGNYELKQKNTLINSYDVGLGLAILYSNGSWRSDAIQDSLLFTDNDPNRPTQLALDLSEEIRKLTFQSYVSIGGNAGGNKLHPTLTPDQHNAEPGVNNSFPGTNPGIATLVPGGDILSSPPGSNPLLTDPLNTLFGSSPSFYGKNISNNILLYPKDILENQQDTLRITQYELKLPSGTDLFNSTPGDIVKGGFTGLPSGTKVSRGQVILPVPNNAADNNSTAWGADQMNNLTAGMVSLASKNLGASIGVAAIGSAIESIFGANPTQAVAYGSLMASAGGWDNLTPEVKQMLRTAVTSAVLKTGGFDVPPEQILARTGVVPNSNLELLFNNVTLREFTFSYRLSPRNDLEAKDVRKIIQWFKRGMAAKKTSSGGSNGAGVFLASPNVFKLEYKTSSNKEIDGLNKFKLCALTNFAANYSPDGQWSAYDEGQPVSINIGMSFTELEPIYESDYDENANNVGF